ncbi:MAG: pyridoxamine 5'-phosphate oxidase family protein [Thermoanaerobacterales bacterium]|nr:pyridoxamine 5'-phosphate oxidase family protein [Thermoanaerobacterales bacterium]
MRRKDKQVSDKTLLYSVIEKATVCRMGLVDNDRPYIVPLCFGFDGTHIYIHSAKSGEKVRILRQNNNVCLEFEQDIEVIKGHKPCQWSMRYFTVIVHGKAELVDDITQKSYGLSRIISHYSHENKELTFTAEDLESVLLFKITPISITGKASGIRKELI